MIKAAIIGATGYTGSELVRLLVQHPKVEIALITSQSRAGEPFSDVHPQFTGICDQKLQFSEAVDEVDLDICFLALPHRVAMDYVANWREKPFRIVDLSGDFRLSSAAVYEKWYSKAHIAPDLVSEVPYGLPEFNRDVIAGAQIVANPGCYPTASTLGLAPLIAHNKIEPDSIIIDAKSGTTGAGIKTSPTTHFANVNDNFKAYGLKNHRHTIEIEETLAKLNGKEVVQVQFTPHLLPVDRGILATAYATPTGSISEDELRQLYQEYYKDEPFVRIRNMVPELKNVRGTNFCDIFPVYDQRTNRIIVISSIDNLVKGAAGQAIQNMNLMFNLDESSGLRSSPLQP